MASTSAPEILAQSGAVAPMTWPEYAREKQRLRAYKQFVPIRTRPPTLSANARFGLNVLIGDRNVSWVLDGDAQAGYTVYVDLNANGNLADDTPIRLTENRGRFVQLLLLPRWDRVVKRMYRVPTWLEIRKIGRAGEARIPRLLMHADAVRRGTIQIDDRAIAFKLVGMSGIYNEPHGYLLIDTDGDGALDSDTLSPDRYRIDEQTLNVGNTSYRFHVHRYGDTLALEPLSRRLPDRQPVHVGARAPDFAFVDRQGVSRRLRDYRGTYVLLDFWGAWCAPCRRQAPDIVEMRKQLSDEQIAFVGITEHDPKNADRFIAEHKLNWPQTIEDEPAIRQLYRVDSWPRYILINPEGKIEMRTYKWHRVRARLLALFDDRPVREDPMLDLMPRSRPWISVP